MGMKLIKFGAPWCPPCQAMSKARTIEKFKEKHPEVEIEFVDMPDDDQVERLENLGDADPVPDDLKQAAENESRAQGDYDVQALPTIIFEEDGVELGRRDEAMTLRGLEEMYEAAKKKLRRKTAR